MLDALAAAAVNHLLHSASWARDRLVPFAGASVRVVLPPFTHAFVITDEGTLQAATDVEPTATIKLTPSIAVRLLVLRDESARSEVEVQGDAALAGALTRVLGTLRWDVEEDLSHLVGDIAAHRIARTGSAFLHWQAATASNLARAMGEYWTEERPAVASRETLRTFAEAVDAIRDDTGRLEKRVERLLERVPSGNRS